jgi:hypothetical protein
MLAGVDDMDRVDGVGRMDKMGWMMKNASIWEII